MFGQQPLRRREPRPLPQAGRREGTTGTVMVLFGSLFSAQASLVVLSPVISRVAVDLGVPVALVGQLRSVSGVAAMAAALAVPLVRRRPSLRGTMATGLLLLLIAAVASMLAPTFAALAAAQVVLGVGVALTLTAGLAATAAWVPEERQGHALSWALIGQPSAWIVGLPIIGVAGESDWRLAWLVPAAASAVTLAAVRRRSSDPAPVGETPDSRRPPIVSWAVAELLAYAGWTGILIYTGALFTQQYHSPAGAVGLMLGIGAAAYLPGNLLARRWLDRRSLSRFALVLSVALACAMALTALTLTTVHPVLGASVALFAVFAFLGGGRTMAASALGLGLGGPDRLRAMSLRTAAVQLGYAVGAGAGGVGLAVGGWTGLGIVVMALFALSVTVLLQRMRPVQARRPRPGLRPSRHRPSGRTRRLGAGTDVCGRRPI